MCGACGVLAGGAEWVERVGNADGAGHAPGLTRIAERQRRVALANLLLAPSGLRLADLGSRLVLRSATGRTEIVDTLMHVWTAADRLGRRPVDPLDESFVRGLKA